jgi:cell division septal protein FtsQ
MSKKSPLKATKLHQRKRKIRILKGTFIVVVIALIFGLSILFSHLALFRINSVQVEGNVSIDQQDVQALAQKELAGAYGALYAKSNKLIYPKKTIETDIKNTFPSIETLNVDAKGHTLDVSITERKPSYIWCKGMPGDTTSEGCYFMDGSGYIFADGPQVSGNAYLTFYGLITDENPIGKQYLSADQMKGFEYIKEALDKMNISLESFVAEDDDVRDIELTTGGKIIFKADQTPELVASSIKLLKEKTLLLNVSATTSLEYIDLRFGNKVYYKFIGDNAVQSEQ